MSPRLLCNLLYVELSRRTEHDEKCRPSRCSSKCDWSKFHAELTAPLLDFEIEEAKRIRARRQLLASGEIPA